MRLFPLAALALLVACGGSDAADPTDTGTPTDTHSDGDADTDADADADADADTDADADADADADTDADTDADADADTDADTDTDATADTGTPITLGGCMAGVSQRLPTQQLPALVEGRDGELGFDAVSSCSGGVADVQFPEHNLRTAPDLVMVDGWDLSDGSWLGEWSATFDGVDTWQVATPSLGTCSDAWMFSGVGRVQGVNGYPTGTEDTTGQLTVWSAGIDTNNGVTVGTVEAPGADEVWMWAVYPDLDEAYGPFPLPNTYQDDYDVAVDLAAAGLRGDGLVFGFVSCQGGQITAAHGR